MFLNQQNRVVGRFSSVEKAGKGLDQLVLAGFPLAKVFLLGEDLADWQDNGKAVDGTRIVDQAEANAITGTGLGLAKGLVAGNILGGATGVLLGMGILALPGLGQVALASAAIFTLVSGGVCTAAGGVIGSLIGLGLTEKQVKLYREQISCGKYLLIVNGTEREIQCAERILSAQRVLS